MAWSPKPRRLYRLLLRAYPAEFREEYGDDMAAMAEHSGVAVLLCDTLANAPREHGDILRRDLRQAIRMLCRAPGFLAAALLALALGIGSAITVFSLAQATLLHPLPYGGSSQLVYLWTPLPRYANLPRELAPSFADIADWQAESHSFTQITGLAQTILTLNLNSAPVRVPTAQVLGNFFFTLESQPFLGRTLTEADARPGHAPVAVIGYRLWRTYFGGTAAALGKVISTPDREYQIVGVMPPEFAYPHATDFPLHQPLSPETQIWVPLVLTPQQWADRMLTADAALGRLRPGVPLAHAQAEMETIERRQDKLNLPEMQGMQVWVAPFRAAALGRSPALLRLLGGAAALLLLIACANVANLLLARALERRREMRIRQALGAPRSRLLRQALTEALLLALAGTACGLALAALAVRLVRSMNPGNIPRLGAATLDASAVAAALLLALVTSVAFGLAPALLLARTDAANRLRSFGQGRFTAPHGAGSGLAARGGLIVADVALAVVLITGAGLLVQSFRYMRSEDKGYSASALTLRLETAMTPRPSAARWGVMLHAAVERLAALPGVTAAGATDSLPLTGDTRLSTFQVTGFANHPNQQADLQYISGDYLQAVGTRLLQGRLVTTSDMPGSTSGTAPARSLAVVVSASFARTYFPDRDAVGGEVTRGDPHHPSRFHVVGVVEDVRHAGLDQPVRPTIYQPSWLADVAVVRSALPASRLVPEVRRALRDADGSLFLEDVQTMGQREGRDAAQRRFQTVLLSGFAIMAGALALIGLYGLLSYTVRRQIPEIGVRMALGASPAAIVAATVRRGAGLALAGGALGVVLALASNRLLAGLVYGISPVDPVTYILAPLAMLATAAAASWMPARRAARVDPVRALRRE